MNKTNYADTQYLNLLRKIIVENAISDYDDIKIKLEIGDISVKDAYNMITDNNQKPLSEILPTPSSDRTGTGTYKIFGHVMRFRLSDGFPLITTKKIPSRLPLGELFWIMSGSSNIKPLVDKNNHIWDEWPYKEYTKSDEYKNNPLTQEEFIQKISEDENFASKYGKLGPVYGAQWRNFGGHDLFKTSIEELLVNNPKFKADFNHLINEYDLKWDGAKGVDQLTEVINKLKSNPNDRRMLIFAYNPQEVKYQILPSCLAMYQFYVKDNKLSALCYIRSQDTFLGCPFDIVSGAALTHMVAQAAGYEVGEYIHFTGDTHIYANHLEQVQEQLSREPYDMPTIELDSSIKNIEDFNEDNVKITNYQAHPTIKAKVSV